jgi:DNA repair protein RecO (recombination protein O)
VRHQTADALILATYPLREKDRIVSFLTRDSGKKRGVARGARGPRNPYAGSLEPMTEARLVYFEKDAQELVSINSADLLRSSFPLSKDLDRALLLSAMAESLQTFVSDSDPAEPFYRLARHALDALFAGADAAWVAAYFDVWILKLSGLFASPSECAVCGGSLDAREALLFDEARPGFVHADCRQGEALRLSSAAREALRRILTSPLDPSARPAGVAEVATVTRRARRHFLGHELKSQRVLAQVMSEVETEPLR